MTNTTGSAATLAGWIDYDGNGLFHASEGATIAVPSGTSGAVTLVFPTVPVGAVASTYARFRLSTDAAGLNPVGAASNGEVEDYQVTITAAPAATISLTLDGSNNLVVTDTAGGGQNDAITIKSNTTSSVFVINDPTHTISTSIAGAVGANTNTVTIPFGSVAGSQILVNTLAGNDSLTVDFSLGNFSKSISYDGGTQTTSDSLTLTGGSTFTSVAHTFNSASAGSVAITGNSSIGYTGLEPVTDNLSATNRSFTFTGGAETITLADASGASMTIDSTLGESVTFANPTTSLTINAGTGDDIVTISSVDASFAAALTINGDAGSADVVNLNAALNTGAGALAVTAEQINLGAANYTTNGSAVTLSGKVALTTSVTIDTNSDNTGTGGAVTISSGSAAVPTLYGNDNGVANLTLTIDTSSSNAAAGNVTLGRVKNNDAAQSTNEFLAKLTVNADGTTDGVITLTSFFDTLDNEIQSVQVDGIGIAGGVEMIGTVSISLNTRVDTNRTAGQDAGDLDFDSALVTNTVLGANFILDASASGAGQGGNVRLGDFDDAGAGFVRIEGLGVYATDDSGPTGTITFTDRNGDGVATINFDGGGCNFFASTIILAAGVHLAIDAFAATPFNTPGSVIFTDVTNTWNTTLNGSGAGNEQITIDASGIQTGVGTIRLPTIGNSVRLGGVSISTPSFPIVLQGNIATTNLGSAALNGNVTLGGNVSLTARRTIDTGSGSPGTLAFAASNDLGFVIDGPTVNTQYTQLNMNGLLNLTGVDLQISGLHTPVAGQSFTIIDNDGADAVMGTFNGLTQGATLVNFMSSGLNATITYIGGNGNDVVIQMPPAVAPNVNLLLNPSSLAEDGGTLTVVATLSNVYNQDVTVNLALSGTAGGADYSASGTSIVITAGNTSGSITLTGLDDLTDEPNESIVVDVSSVVNGTENGVQQVTATITDDDQSVAPVLVTNQTLIVAPAEVARLAVHS